MFALTDSHRFLLYSAPTDMRKSFDALSGIVENRLNRKVETSEVFVFVFVNRRRDKIKLLHWVGSGFVLYYKRLEQGTFEIPHYKISDSAIRLSYAQMVMLIDGLSIVNIKKRVRFSSTVQSG